MAIRFSEEALAEVQEIFARYPTRRAAVMPVLWLAQREFGWLSTEVQEHVAEVMEIPLSWVAGVVSFYTMYNRRPMGRHHLQVCTNLSCMLRGSDAILEAISGRLGIGPGETTEDRRFSLDEVECLGSCGTAPMLQVNDGPYHENLDPESVIALIDRLSEA